MVFVSILIACTPMVPILMCYKLKILNVTIFLSSRHRAYDSMMHPGPVLGSATFMVQLGAVGPSGIGLRNPYFVLASLVSLILFDVLVCSKRNPACNSPSLHLHAAIDFLVVHSLLLDFRLTDNKD